MAEKMILALRERGYEFLFVSELFERLQAPGSTMRGETLADWR